METKTKGSKGQEQSKDFVWNLFDSILENAVRVFK